MANQSYTIEQLDMEKHGDGMYTLWQEVKGKYPGGIYWYHGDDPEEWVNCFVCLKGNQVIGKAQVMVWSEQVDEAPEYAKHAVFIHVRVLPQFEEEEEVLLKLYNKALERAKELQVGLGHTHQCQLYMGNVSHEKTYNEFAERMGHIEHGSLLYLECSMVSSNVSDEAMRQKGYLIKDYTFDSKKARVAYLEELEWQCFEDDIMSMEQLEGYLESDRVIALAAYDKDKLIGAVWATQNGEKEPFIQGLCVLSDYRRKSIAETLIRSLNNRLLDQGYKRVELCVLTDNTAAIKLYEKLGFKVDVEEKRYRIFI